MKYKAEKNIEQIPNNDGTWTFKVRVRLKGRDIVKRFNEKKYNSAQIAWMEAKKFRNSAMSGDIEVNENATVREVFDGMQDMYGRSFETRRKEESLLRTYVLNYIDDDSQFGKLSRETIQKMINDMSYKCTRNTMGKAKTLLSKMYKYAIDKNIVRKDQTLTIVIPKPKTSPKPKKVMVDRDTFNAVLDACREHLGSINDRTNYPRFLTLGYYTGMRPAEIFALNKKDVHLDQRYITISKSISQDDIGVYYVGNTKTEESNRIIPIHDELIPTLTEALEYKPKNPLLFSDKNGKIYNSTSVSSVLKRLCERRGLEFNMYMLRHTFIQNLIDNGVQLRTIMSLCGHIDPSMVIKYSRSSQQMNFEAVQSIKKVDS